MFCPHACMCIMCVPHAWGGQRKVLDFPSAGVIVDCNPAMLVLGDDPSLQ